MAEEAGASTPWLNAILNGKGSSHDFDSLRLACRDESFVERLLIQERPPLINQLTGAAAGATTTSDGSSSAVAAAAALSNILYWSSSLRHDLVKDPYFDQLLHLIATLPEDGKVVHLRVFFLLTIDAIGSQRALSRQRELCLLQSLVTRCRHSTEYAVIMEILRILFNLTRFVEPEGELIRVLVPLLIRCFEYPGDDQQEQLDIQGNAMHIILNCPWLFAPTSSAPADALSERKHLITALCCGVENILVAAAAAAAAKKSTCELPAPLRPQEYVRSMCAALQKVCAAEDGGEEKGLEGQKEGKVRRTLRHRLFSSMQMKNCLQQLLTDGNDAMEVLLLGDLLLLLVGGNISRLVFHLGYESLAGYLCNRQLSRDEAQLQPQQEDEEDVPFSSDEELMMMSKASAASGPSVASTSASVEMTEEEKSAESARLIDLFTRLEANGVIKLQRPKKK